MDFSEYVWLVPVIAGSVEALKAIRGFEGGWCVLAAIVLGLGLVFGLEFAPYYTGLAVRGVVVGLSVSGLYRIGKRAGDSVLDSILNGRG